MVGVRLARGFFAVVVSGLLCPALVSAQTPPPPQVVDFVDLERYDGLWFELARARNPFQIGCVCVTAAYEIITPATVSVYNVCNTFTAQGATRTIEGSAEVVDESTNAKLEVSFFDGAPPGDYWIVDLVENPADPQGEYQFAAVSDRARAFVFILARSPTLETAADRRNYRDLLERLEGNGFDTSRLMRSRQPASCDYSDRLGPQRSIFDRFDGVAL